MRVVRATAALVLVRLGGIYSPGWDATNVATLTVRADSLLDGYTWPAVLSTTDTSVIEVAVDIVLRLMEIANYMHAGGVLSKASGTAPSGLEVFTPELKSRIDLLKSSTTNYGVMTVDAIDTSD